MEVQKHPHNVTQKKKWEEYFLEFLMIFLAVFLGFIAENIREHVVDQNKEKQYILSMIEDLKNDTTNFPSFLELNMHSQRKIDSLIILLGSRDIEKHGSELYFLARTVMTTGRLYFSVDRTFSQLKSSGNLRLITSQGIADSISSYYFNITLLNSQLQVWTTLTEEYIKQVSNVFDASIFQQMLTQPGLQVATSFEIPQINPPIGNPRLANISKEALISLIGVAHFLYTRSIVCGNLAKKRVNEARALIGQLQKEYHLEK